jgi:enamine deaminase RidA (YjgF/YER057c/UK114 family)
LWALDTDEQGDLRDIGPAGTAVGGIEAQARQALANVVAILAGAGARPEHIGRMTWYVVDKREYLACGKALGAAYREIMGRHFPAMTAVEVTALMEDAARVEIEATAVVPVDSAQGKVLGRP